MLVLVTGATGLLGNNVVRLLLDRGVAVRVLERSTSSPRPLKGLKVEKAVGDVREPDSLRVACRGVDTVIHAAAYVHIGWSNQDVHRAVNVEGTRNVAQAALEAGARMIHVSSVDALGHGTCEAPANEETTPDLRETFPYVVTKREAERVVLDFVGRGLHAVIVNPTYMLGPWDWKPSSGRMLLVVAETQPMFAPRGGNDFCDVRDVAEGILAAIDRGQPGRRYILGGEAMRYVDAWRMFAEVAERRPPLCRAGPLMVRGAGLIGDLCYRVTGRELDINSAATSMSAIPHHFTYARAAAELDYTPRPAREAAKAAWDWFLANGYVVKAAKGRAIA
ncbi:MAG TPA: NAD-dependent epimerase/dehydratase family protein [Pirellulales bacterium]|nr:NAD-dependent epimerase/dehydratase family protein [Pirellulales bacterium]